MGRFAALEWLESQKVRWLRALLFLLLWLTLLDFPREVSIEIIDNNWMLCLGHFLSNRWQCGVHYVWTYGPLGALMHHVYDADLFWWKYAWEVSVKFALAWLLFDWSELLRRGWTRTGFLILALVFLPGAADALYLFCLVLLGLLPLCDQRWRTPARLAAAAVVLAVLSLTKFTFLLLGVIVWAIVGITPGLRWRGRAVLLLAYPAAWLIGWVLLGQSLVNVPRYLAASAEIARGYGEGMAKEGSIHTFHAGLAELALFLGLLACYRWSQLRRRENLLGVMLLSAGVFLVWKHGFIRQDGLHLFHFFGFLLLVPFAVEGLLGEPTPPSRIRASLMSAMIVIGVLCRGPVPRPIDWLNRLRFNGVVVLEPMQLKHSLDKERDRIAQQWALPAIQKAVGQESVDLISLLQGVLFLNRLNYHPRPVFQSYSTYTPDLLERNAAFYRSDRAPAFVIIGLQALDDHLPAMEDGLTLLELFRRYHPIVRENDLLLLKRRIDAALAEAPAHPVLLQRTIAFDEEVRVDELGGVHKLLSIRIDDSLLGWLRKAVFRPLPLFLHLHTQDGGTYSYRLIPGMASCDFLLDPLLREQEDIEKLYAGKPLPRVRSFSVHVDPNARIYFKERMEIRLRGDEGLAGLTEIKKK